MSLLLLFNQPSSGPASLGVLTEVFSAAEDMIRRTAISRGIQAANNQFQSWTIESLVDDSSLMSGRISTTQP
jgi:hypothetical protein